MVRAAAKVRDNTGKHHGLQAWTDRRIALRVACCCLFLTEILACVGPDSFLESFGLPFRIQ